MIESTITSYMCSARSVSDTEAIVIPRKINMIPPQVFELTEAKCYRVTSAFRDAERNWRKFREMDKIQI
ncbi:hypothetical protein E2C01_061435 [Portunus trituberculatus]|uniref:Uncharacterized protein n=1 Tax=Portunus trituberculatus TaxID=210409 RepID=A0A5B7H839_PORTR|nr:hypothetical protein [Portunus trituberculatus]